jgi:hypothetical protein
MPFNDVLYNISYSNIRLYFAVLPTYDSKDKAEEKDNKKSAKGKGGFGGLLSMLKSTGDGSGK